MPLNVSYMGTKRELATAVSQVISQCPQGPVLDLFAGMCSVASAVDRSRNVWCNDVQYFASQVAMAFFVSGASVPNEGVLADLALPYYMANKKALTLRFQSQLVSEARAIAKANAPSIVAMERRMPNVATDSQLDRERRRLAAAPRSAPYRLFAFTYSGAYFGLAQSIQIDSLRFAADELLARAAISREEHRWMVLATCQAACKVATTTGHFMRASHEREVRHHSTLFWRGAMLRLAGLERVASRTRRLHPLLWRRRMAQGE